MLSLPLSASLSAVPSAIAEAAGLQVGSLTTEHTADPLGIDASHPLLGWVITSNGRGVSQSGYEIRVAKDENGLRSGRDPVWDSGMVRSGQSFDVPYRGPALAPQTRYYWQVRVWDDHGRASQWSGPDAWFETAFLDPSQFQGSWIGSPASMAGPELLLRKDFALAGRPITKARLYLASPSYPYVSINGRPISDHVLDSAFTAFDKTVDYSTYDVTQLMRGGSNAITLSLGNGFYAGGANDYPSSGQPWQPAQPTLKLELEVWDANGTATRVLSDASWKVATGPTTANAPDVETYDARLERTGWTQTGYDDSGWAGDIVLPDANAPVPSYSGTPVANWIWNTAGASNAAPAGTIYLRKTFTVTDPSSLSSALLRVNGDDGDQAYVNGKLVSSSPGTVLNSWQNSQVTDIRSLLVPGTNVIALAGIANHPDASGVIATAQLDSTRIVTDGTWKALPGLPASPPAGWNTAGFDDSSWPAATVQGPYGMAPWGTNVRLVTGPAGVLRAQSIPPVKKTATVNPVKVTDLPGVNVPVPSYAGTPVANWIWNTAGSSNAAPAGTIYLRKTFTVTDPSSLSSAVLRVNGDDGDQAYVNGKLVSTSSGTVDNSWQNSQVTDIRSLMVPGTNVIALAGIANQPNASGVIATAQLDSTRIVTDGTWKALPGTPASPPAGWNTAGFDDSSWPAATVQGPYGMAPWGTNISTPAGPSKVYDFGITTSGWARITMRGTAGTQVQVIYSERLNSDGTVQHEGANAQTDTYVLKGGGPETYEPKYGWKGYRYVQVSVAPDTALPAIQSATGVVVHTALPTSGEFTSSDDLLNRMHVAMKNTILNNQYSYGSDTPVYEKGGWTNDNADYATSEMANFDAESYYDHMMRNFADSQDSAGNIGFLVPAAPGNDNVDPLWGGSFVLIEYDALQRYNDLAMIRRDYHNLTAYVDDMANQIASSGYIYQGTTFGDWVPPGNGNPPSSQLLGSMFLYQEADDLATMAAAIGDTSGATKYRTLATTIRSAVNNEFYDATSHRYRDPLGLNSHALGGPNGPITSTAYDQTGNVFGLAFGLAPDGDQQAVADGLAADVVAQGNHLSTGANGSKYILPMLSRYGHAELAYKVATNPTAPGWGQWFLQCGATTMWESWEDSSCGTARSRDHAFMGTVDDWLFEGVAGIQSTSPGFRTFTIDPYPVGNLTNASGSETTPLGRVSSDWTRSGSNFDLTVQIPVGAQASVCVPATSARSVTESGAPIDGAPGVAVAGMRGSCVQLHIGSGTYRFHSTMP
ncbi:alpha-L-rhamnosidase [Amycolatopsis rhizosphaerae]|uniref:alpha-L-rhamnosidase n=1 Tax=Amycolatopsis rhizosphaerae TaxID=2053003 RepID=UPI00164372AB|nr:alpha-L-rhamnosidase [Amycolatopsis rhizosphaerae]